VSNKSDKTLILSILEEYKKRQILVSPLFLISLLRPGNKLHQREKIKKNKAGQPTICQLMLFSDHVLSKIWRPGKRIAIIKRC